MRKGQLSLQYLKKLQIRDKGRLHCLLEFAFQSKDKEYIRHSHWTEDAQLFFAIYWYKLMLFNMFNQR